MDTTVGKRLIEIRARIVGVFTAGNWEELGLLTKTTDIITAHPRLLRSLHWGDNDYAGNVLTVLRQMVEQHLNVLAEIEAYLDERFASESTYVSAKPRSRRITFSPHVFDIPTQGAEPDLLAVMMPFGMDFDAVYESITRAASERGLRCCRADQVWDNPIVVQDIFSLIYRAEVVLCDFTQRNANVMYETGIAHALGKNVILLSRRLEEVPFNIRHHRVLQYLPNEEGLTKLRSDLLDTFRQLSIGTQ